MILKKLWRMLMAWLNSGANTLRKRDPVAEMQYEVDRITESMRKGREGLELHRGLVERVSRQIGEGKGKIAEVEGQIRYFLENGYRTAAANLALDLKEIVRANAENESQLVLLEEAYRNNILKATHDARKLQEARNRVAGYSAKLQYTKASAEAAQLSQAIGFDVTTDFGDAEEIVKGQIDANIAAVRVAADLSGQGIEAIRQEQSVVEGMAENALKAFESKMNLLPPAP